MLNFVSGYSEVLAPLYQRLNRLFEWANFRWGENREEAEPTADESAYTMQIVVSPREIDAHTNVMLTLARSHWTNLSK